MKIDVVTMVNYQQVGTQRIDLEYMSEQGKRDWFASVFYAMLDKTPATCKVVEIRIDVKAFE